MLWILKSFWWGHYPAYDPPYIPIMTPVYHHVGLVSIKHGGDMILWYTADKVGKKNVWQWHDHSNHHWIHLGLSLTSHDCSDPRPKTATRWARRLPLMAAWMWRRNTQDINGYLDISWFICIICSCKSSIYIHISMYMYVNMYIYICNSIFYIYLVWCMCQCYMHDIWTDIWYDISGELVWNPQVLPPDPPAAREGRGRWAPDLEDHTILQGQWDGKIKKKLWYLG